MDEAEPSEGTRILQLAEMKLRQANECEKGFVERLPEQRLATSYANGALVTHPRWQAVLKL